jgi:hypothetical protein
MEKQMHSIASDYLRGAMLHYAMRKAAELAKEGFYHGLETLDMEDEGLSLFTEEAWQRYTLTITFDYSRYAHRLFLQAYGMAYHAYATELPNARHPDLQTLITEFEKERGLTLQG